MFYIVGLKGISAKMNWLAVNRQSWSNSDSELVQLEGSPHSERTWAQKRE
jgi:hypothetical protein